MQDLSTARVLLVDDVAKESLPILKALGRTGIGCAYFSGERVEELEGVEPLRGIRLAFVDMRLGTFGTTRQAVAKTVNVLGRLIAQKTSPLVIVAWTQNPDDIPEFKEMLRGARPDLRPLISAMPKPFEDDGDNINASRLDAALRRLPKTFGPLNVVWAWEQLSHEATSSCTQVIAEIATQRNPAQDGDDASWLRALSDTILLLVAMGAGKHRDSESAARALTEVLASIHLDRIENGPLDTMRCQTSALPRRSVPSANLNEQAVLNTMLHIAPVDPADRILRPGSVFLPTEANRTCAPASVSSADADDLCEDILGPKSEQARTECRQKCRVCFVETTPSCDFAQRTRTTARFVAGLIVPDVIEKRVKPYKPSSRRLPPIILPGQGETIWHPVLSARFLYGVSKRSGRIRSPVVARLRTDLLTDIQSWLAAHWARPGFLSVP